MIPLYGFLEGDTVGLLVFAYEDETVARIAEKLQKSASIRVAHRERVRVIHDRKSLDPGRLVSEVGFRPLDRFDVVSDSP